LNKLRNKINILKADGNQAVLFQDSRRPLAETRR